MILPQRIEHTPAASNVYRKASVYTSASHPFDGSFVRTRFIALAQAGGRTPFVLLTPPDFLTHQLAEKMFASWHGNPNNQPRLKQCSAHNAAAYGRILLGFTTRSADSWSRTFNSDVRFFRKGKKGTKNRALHIISGPHNVMAIDISVGDRRYFNSKSFYLRRHQPRFENDHSTPFLHSQKLNPTFKMQKAQEVLSKVTGGALGQKLPTRKLGKNGPEVTALGYGTMGLVRCC